MRRVFADDVLQCPCGGRRSVIAIVADPTIARMLLTALGLPNEPSTFAPARAPPQVELAWADAHHHHPHPHPHLNGVKGHHHPY